MVYMSGRVRGLVAVACVALAGVLLLGGSVANASSTVDAPPGPPTGGHTTSVTDTCVTIAWTAPVGVVVDHYEVYVDGAVIVKTPSTTATICGLRPATQYVITIVVADRDGNVSLPSQPLIVVTRPSPCLVCGATPVAT